MRTPPLCRIAEKLSTIVFINDLGGRRLTLKLVVKAYRMWGSLPLGFVRNGAGEIIAVRGGACKGRIAERYRVSSRMRTVAWSRVSAAPERRYCRSVAKLPSAY